MSSDDSGQNDNVVNLLWTGGWDSTFRLLSLIRNYSCSVQPYYVIIPSVPSWRIEIRTTKRIMEACASDGTRFKGTILPPEIVDGRTFAVDSEFESRYRALRSIARLGPQYIWLAQLAKEFGIKNLELGIHRDDVAHAILAKHVKQKQGFPTQTFVMDPDADRSLSLFAGFEFPLFDMTKKQMEGIARQQSFSELMEMTWFCHRPIGGRFACGSCHPCYFAINEGMGRRVGWRGRLRNTVHRQWVRTPLGVRRSLKPYIEKAWPRLRADR